MLAFLVPVVLLATGVATGVLIGTQLGGWPLLASLPPSDYVRAHAFFATRYDPFMPICLLAATAGSVALSLVLPPVAAVLYGLAAVCLASTVAISLTKNVPVNRWVTTLDPSDLPADFAQRDPRRRWGAWNRTRTTLTAVALVLQCTALSFLL